MRTRSWTIPKELTETEIKENEEKTKKSLKKDKSIYSIEIIETVEYNKDGSKTTKYERKKHNVSKQINETAKKLKIDNANKLTELLKAIGIEQGENI